MKFDVVVSIFCLNSALALALLGYAEWESLSQYGQVMVVVVSLASAGGGMIALGHAFAEIRYVGDGMGGYRAFRRPNPWFFWTGTTLLLIGGLGILRAGFLLT